MPKTTKKQKKKTKAKKTKGKKMKGKNPCWKGYQMVGMKEKGGRRVPNCVPRVPKK